MDENINSSDELSDRNIKKADKINQWKEYAIQFILIFLAVTLGFVADNIRENIAEKKIARQNLVDYKNDLIQHELMYSAYIKRLPRIAAKYDSIVSIFYNKNENKELTVLSRLLLEGQLNLVIEINTPTYEQLINSGSMRFIENKNLKGSISGYNNKIDYLINYNDRMINTQNNLAGELGKIVDVHDFWSTQRIGTSYTPEMQSFTLNDEQRKFLIAYYQLYKVQVLGILNQLKKLSKDNVLLVILIDKELGN